MTSKIEDHVLANLEKEMTEFTPEAGMARRHGENHPMWDIVMEYLEKGMNPRQIEKTLKTNKKYAKYQEADVVPCFRTIYDWRAKVVDGLPVMNRKFLQTELQMLFLAADTFDKKIRVLRIMNDSLPKENLNVNADTMALYADSEAILGFISPTSP